MLKAIKNIIHNNNNDEPGFFCSAIIVAAGKGSRMKSEVNKIFLDLIDRPVLAYTLQAFEDCRLINEIIIVTRDQDIMLCKEIIDILELKKVTQIVTGGKERQDSVSNGLREVNDKAVLVAIHDGARPLIQPEEIEMTIQAAIQHRAAALGVRVKDTIKLVDEDSNIIKTLDRSKLWAVHTPQVFEIELLKEAQRRAFEEGIYATDDCMLVERMGVKVKMVEGRYENIKITTPEDLFTAEAILSQIHSL